MGACRPPRIYIKCHQLPNRQLPNRQLPNRIIMFALHNDTHIFRYIHTCTHMYTSTTEMTLYSYGLLLHLVTTISTCKIYNESEFGTSIVHILTFEFSLSCFLSPTKTFINVNQTINCRTNNQNTPPSCFGNLWKNIIY